VWKIFFDKNLLELSYRHDIVRKLKYSPSIEACGEGIASHHDHHIRHGAHLTFSYRVYFSHKTIYVLENVVLLMKKTEQLNAQNAHYSSLFSLNKTLIWRLVHKPELRVLNHYAASRRHRFCYTRPAFHSLSNYLLC
jgi:hypothetical protein